MALAQTAACGLGASSSSTGGRPTCTVSSPLALPHQLHHARGQLKQQLEPAHRSKAARGTLLCRAAASAPVENAANTNNGTASSAIPKPVVKIDNQSDPFATVVSIQFGDRLGELLDTVAALKNLGLNIRRAKITTVDGVAANKFYITDATTSEKILKSARLEEIRLTILNNLLYYHPESGEELAWGARAKQPTSRSSLAPLGPRSGATVTTTVEVSEHPSGSHSAVRIVTTDRPGLLVEIVRVLKDINVNVVSAEVDTEGSRARDEFFVTYHGEPLNPSMTQLVTNALQYYLSLGEIEREESY